MAGNLSGNVMQPTGGQVMPGSKPRIGMCDAVPTDDLVGGITTGAGVRYRTPVNGELAENVATGYVYERQTAVWTRIDT